MHFHERKVLDFDSCFTDFFPEGPITSERGNSRDARSAVDILWRLHFACLTCTRAECVISAKTSRKWKHCLPYTRWILSILFYNAHNKYLPIMNTRLHQTVACTICIFWNDALVCLVISLKFINTEFVHSLLNSITTPCMVLLLLPEVPAGETAPPYQLLPGCPLVTLPARV